MLSFVLFTTTLLTTPTAHAGPQSELHAHAQEMRSRGGVQFSEQEPERFSLYAQPIPVGCQPGDIHYEITFNAVDPEFGVLYGLSGDSQLRLMVYAQTVARDAVLWETYVTLGEYADVYNASLCLPASNTVDTPFYTIAGIQSGENAIVWTTSGNLFDPKSEQNTTGEFDYNSVTLMEVRRVSGDWQHDIAEYPYVQLRVHITATAVEGYGQADPIIRMEYRADTATEVEHKDTVIQVKENKDASR